MHKSVGAIRGLKKDLGSLGLGLQATVQRRRRCREQNSGPLEDQEVLSTTELSLQPLGSLLVSVTKCLRSNLGGGLFRLTVWGDIVCRQGRHGGQGMRQLKRLSCEVPNPVGLTMKMIHHTDSSNLFCFLSFMSFLSPLGVDAGISSVCSAPCIGLTRTLTNKG